MGFELWRCQPTNAVNATTPIAMQMNTIGSDHPRHWDSIKAYIVAVTPAADKLAPTTSMRECTLGPGIGHSQNAKANPTTIGIAERT